MLFVRTSRPRTTVALWMRQAGAVHTRPSRPSAMASKAFIAGMPFHNRTLTLKHRFHILIPLVLGGGSLILLSVNAHPIRKDGEEETDESSRPGQASIPSLLRSYVVYTMCSVPQLVDWSPSIISTLFAVPILREFAELIIRQTFFQQFVGGDSAEATIPLIQAMREENKGVLLAYSVEVDEIAATGETTATKDKRTPVLGSHKHNVEEMLRCIDAAGDFEDRVAGMGLQGIRKDGRRTWVALKLSALTSSAATLINLSEYLTQTRSMHPSVPFPGVAQHNDLSVLDRNTSAAQVGPMSLEDIKSLVELRGNLIRICEKARDRGVKIIIDAEYSWFQPAIDAFALLLMSKFNRCEQEVRQATLFSGWPWVPTTRDQRCEPLIYSTFQAYLRRTPQHLRLSLEDAKRHRYALGVKLVRGAYHPHEIEYHRKRSLSEKITSPIPPVWIFKLETDKCYDECVSLLLSDLARAVQTRGIRPGLLFGTHNWISAKKVLKDLAEVGLAQVTNRASDKELHIEIAQDVVEYVTIGQLFGMSDALTEYLVGHIKSPSPMVIKYVPYGALKEVMPYLSRRAIENKSVLGGPNGAREERRLAAQALRHRLLGW